MSGSSANVPGLNVVVTIAVLPRLYTVGQLVLAREANEIEWSRKIYCERAMRARGLIDTLDTVTTGELMRNERTKSLTDPGGDIHDEA